MHDPLKAARVFWIFFKLGLTSFGGPIAHIGFFRNEFVTCRAWLPEAIFAELLTICQFLPGPSSSQLGFAIGLMRAGWLGALAAFVGFTLPSALALYGFALVVVRFDVPIWLGALAGLKLVAVAVVAQAVCGMAQTLCPDFKRASIGVAAFLAVAFFSTAFGMIATISMAAALGFVLLGQEKTAEISTFHCPVIKRHAWGALGLFVLLIAFLPLVAQGDPMLELFDIFFRAGALVFGGGHAVLPLLQAEMVPQGLMSNGAFLAGYSGVQAVPGPLFTFSAYLGALVFGPSASLLGATLALSAIFLPGFLILTAVLPYWQQIRSYSAAQSMVKGVNAGVVGVLAFSLYHPIFTTSVHDTLDFALVLVWSLALILWRLPPVLIVAMGASVGAALAWF